MASLAKYKKIDADEIVKSGTWINGYYSPVDGSLVTTGEYNPSRPYWQYYYLPWHRPDFALQKTNCNGYANGYIFKCFPNAIDFDGNLEYLMIGAKTRSEGTSFLYSDGITLTYEDSGKAVTEHEETVDRYCIMLAFYDENDSFIKSVYAHWNTNTGRYAMTDGKAVEWILQGACVPAEGLSEYTNNNIERLNHVKIRTKDERYIVDDNTDLETQALFRLGRDYTNDYFELQNACKVRISIGYMFNMTHRTSTGGTENNNNEQELSRLMVDPSTVTVQDLKTNGPVTWLGQDFYFKVYSDDTAPHPPSPQKAVKQNEYIIVYDMKEPQNGFKSNGLAVLTPSRCEVTEELNGGYYVDMDYNFDPDRKYQFLQEFNILKIQGQLFRIRRTTTRWNGNSGKIQVYAEHIFYDLTDEWIYEFENHFGTSVQNNISLVMAASERYHDSAVQDGVFYNFNYDSDLTIDYDIAGYHWDNAANVTLLDLIIGSDGMLSYTDDAGYLYRDNFHFSLRKEMEGKRYNAFDIRPGLNLRGLTKIQDVSTFASVFRAFNSRDQWFAWAWSSAFAFPHHIARSEKFVIDPNDYSDPMKLLGKQATKYFFEHIAPEISYEIDYQDFRMNPEYADFDCDYRMKVGDKGRLILPDGKTMDVEISKTIKDGITGKILKVQFGSVREFTRSGYNVSFEVGELKIKDSSESGVILTQNDDEIHTSEDEAVEVAIMGKLADYSSVEEVNSALNDGKQAKTDVDILMVELFGISDLVGEGIENDS